MSAEEKAKKLVDDMYCEMHNLCITDEVLNEVAKQCALIAVDEILEATKQPRRTYDTTNHGSMEISGYYYSDFWIEVKSEIEKL